MCFLSSRTSSGATKRNQHNTICKSERATTSNHQNMENENKKKKEGGALTG